MNEHDEPDTATLGDLDPVSYVADNWADNIVMCNRCHTLVPEVFRLDHTEWHTAIEAAASKEFTVTTGGGRTFELTPEFLANALANEAERRAAREPAGRELNISTDAAPYIGDVIKRARLHRPRLHGEWPGELDRLRRIESALIELGAPKDRNLSDPDPSTPIIRWARALVNERNILRAERATGLTGHASEPAAPVFYRRRTEPCVPCGMLVDDESHYHCTKCGQRCSMMGHPNTCPPIQDDPPPADDVTVLLDLGQSKEGSLPYLVRARDGWTWSEKPAAHDGTGGLPWRDAASMAVGALIPAPTPAEWQARYEQHYDRNLLVNNPDHAHAYAVDRTTSDLGPEPEWPVSVQNVVDLLSLVGITETVPAVTGWTHTQRTQAADWAGAVHLQASDNQDVVIPPRPTFFTQDNPAITDTDEDYPAW